VVKPDTHYLLSGWIKTEGVVVKQGRGITGATVWAEPGWNATSVVGGRVIGPTWKRNSTREKTPQWTSVPRLGQWAGIVTGTAGSRISLSKCKRQGLDDVAPVLIAAIARISYGGRYAR